MTSITFMALVLGVVFGFSLAHFTNKPKTNIQLLNDFAIRAKILIEEQIQFEKNRMKRNSLASELGIAHLELAQLLIDKTLIIEKGRNL
jgi:hypothetical protein